MNQEQILEGNKLIAEFMGLDTKVFNSGLTNYFQEDWFEAHELSYNVSWDWLIPVVDKISLAFHEVRIISDEDVCRCEILCYDDNGMLHEEIYQYGISLKEATYMAVVEFIKWYNKNK